MTKGEIRELLRGWGIEAPDGLIDELWELMN